MNDIQGDMRFTDLDDPIDYINDYSQLEYNNYLVMSQAQKNYLKEKNAVQLLKNEISKYENDVLDTILDYKTKYNQLSTKIEFFHESQQKFQQDEVFHQTEIKRKTQMEMEKSKHQEDDLHAQFQNIKNQINQIQQKMIKRKYSHSAQMNRLRDAIEEIEIELTTAKDELSEAQAEHDQVARELAQKEKELKDVNQKNTSAKTILKKAKSKYQAAKERLGFHE